jgi:hypothetical protein
VSLRRAPKREAALTRCSTRAARYVSATDMPRISTSAIRTAYAIDPLLPRLLPPCRTLGAAQNELRWLREHVDGAAAARRARGDAVSKGAFLRHLVRQRARGTPLQYLLGTEFFGELEISCRPGVLIPR